MNDDYDEKEWPVKISGLVVAYHIPSHGRCQKGLQRPPLQGVLGD